ncbi:MAG TPA: serpin family protein, partial [Pyrinomonadaceae bacterium]|nr:serpin family protein [Pyrinomonadaceae bacterium]
MKGSKTMPHFVLKSSVKAHAPKAFVAILVALILCSNLPLTAGSKSQVDTRLTSASSRFSLKLYDRIQKGDTSKNTFVSPTSIMLALAMTYNGSYGTTRQAMARALEIDGMSLEEANQAFADLKSVLAPTDPKIQLKIANSLWSRKGFAIKPAFLERNKQYYGAEVASL